jgi:hypothetical protein
MSAVSGILHAVVSPLSYAYKKSGDLCHIVYLDRIAEAAFRFFQSYGNSPKDFAKVLQVLGSWIEIVCDGKAPINETARKVSDFAKQAKCFLSLAGLCTQFADTVGELSIKGLSEAEGLKKMVGKCTGLYSSVFDSISLLSAFELVSPNTRAFRALKLGNSLSTILGATVRLRDDTYKLHSAGVRSRDGWKSAIKLIGNSAVFALGILPLSSSFKNCRAGNSIMLRLSTVTVITNLIDKHIPASLSDQPLLPIGA